MLRVDKERNNVNVMNSSLKSSVCASVVLTALVYIGAKETRVSAPKVTGKRETAFQISPHL